MAELTQPDRDNYKKLQGLVGKLVAVMGDPKVTAGDPKVIAEQKTFLKSLFEKLFLSTPALPDKLDTIEELESRLDKIDTYLSTQNLLLPSPPDAIAIATKELLEHSALIKESLQDVTDADLSTLDDLGSPCSDEQFFRSIEGKPKEWTKALLGNHSQNLDSNQITQLTDAWGIAVSGIVKDAQNQAPPLKPGTPDTISRFFCIHEELEDLYDKVSNLVA
ncbi:MAG: hypothetical protein LH631_11840 [Alkalinema sp. CAN_BIN05]|nr:hypothetical protein [Alkalinema sp. CAN_BIN05]